MQGLINKYQSDIILAIGVVLISLLSFAVGYITAKQEGSSLRFEQKINETESSYNRGWDKRPLLG